MGKKRLFVLLFVCFVSFLFAVEVKEPVEPDDPSASETKETATITKGKYNLDFKKQDGLFYRGYVESLTGFYLDSLTWEGNREGNQAKLIDFVRSIHVKGYQMVKRSAGNLSIVYYIPRIFDIELKNGQMIQNAEGRIPELDTFYVYDETGKEKCFTYFVRYWLEDKKQFSDNGSDDFDETPPLPKELVTFLEFTK